MTLYIYIYVYMYQQENDVDERRINERGNEKKKLYVLKKSTREAE